MAVDLDRLEALATAAEWADPWNDRAWEENGDFIGAADPMTVLALISRVRAAEAGWEASSLACIEAQNPGIDMAEVRRLRSERRVTSTEAAQ